MADKSATTSSAATPRTSLLIRRGQTCNIKLPRMDHSRPLMKQLSFQAGSSAPTSPNVKKSYRLVVLGSCQTGKTAIVNRYLHDIYDESYTPTIENFYRKLFRVKGEFYQLDILDTSGNDPFPATRRLSLLTGDLFLIVFSVDNIASYEEVFRLRTQIIENKAELMNVNDWKQCKIPIIIVANKVDLAECKWIVDRVEIQTRMRDIQGPCCMFFECSAKDNLNIDEIFTKLFAMAKFPKEMSPKLHKRLEQNSSLDSKLGRKSSILLRMRAKTHSGDNMQHCAVESAMESDVRRPSLRTDLLTLKLKAKAANNPSLVRGVTFSTGDANTSTNANSNRSSKCTIQ